MKLAVIVGATRPGRQTMKEALWVTNRAKEMSDVEVELVDLVDYPLPFFDELISPRYNPNREVSPEVQKWLDKLEEFDAYVFVTPEYNHSITGVLKNALDYISSQLVHKPSVVVSHGSVGGARAAMHLKEILSESKSVVVPNSVAFTGISEAINDEGILSEEASANPWGPAAALTSTLEDLKWYSDALSVARENS